MLKMQSQFKKKFMTKPTNILKGLIKKIICGFRGSQKIDMLVKAAFNTASGEHLI